MTEKSRKGLLVWAGVSALLVLALAVTPVFAKGKCKGDKGAKGKDMMSVTTNKLQKLVDDKVITKDEMSIALQYIVSNHNAMVKLDHQARCELMKKQRAEKTDPISLMVKDKKLTEAKATEIRKAFEGKRMDKAHHKGPKGEKGNKANKPKAPKKPK